jgi:hypothetical protein
VSVERDPELARLLEAALDPAVPRRGAERRVEQRLAARLARPARPTPLWTLVGAGVLACALGVFFGRRARTPATSAAPIAAASWLPLAHARVALLGSSALRVEHEDERESVVRLVAGTALFHVQKGTGRRFVVRAGRTRVEVVGTVFGMELEGEHARVEVVEGTVRVSDGEATQTLAAGASSPPGAHVFALTPDELARLRAPFPAASAPRLPSAPTPVAKPASTQEAASSTPPKPSSAAPSRSAPVRAEPLPATNEGSVAASDAYHGARALERSGALDRAISAYRAIASAPGPNAEDAAFALVRLPAERGASGAVLAAVAEYRAAFRAGRYARDVDVLELNAHLARRDTRAAARDADAFLADYPDDARAWRFRLVRGAERARAGECDAATSELARVPDGPEKTAALAPCSGVETP